ncbi:hypothetical protein Ancab_029567 [Ancistrocladus abbreviatus]
MSIESASAVTTPLPSQVPKERVARQSANYHPSIWGERFITCTYDDKVIHAWYEEAEVLKEKVRKMFTDVDFAEKLNLIDSVQRLGVAYNFEGEIKGALEQNFSAYLDHFYHDDDLHRVSLLFRLLRQHGYHVSCDIFNKFKYKEGNFKETLIGDATGLLSLYEAANLRIHGEDILDDALHFTISNLNPMVADLSLPIAKQILHALHRPLQKSLPRLEARWYISFCQENESQNKALSKFAKLDFNIVQKLHQMELSVLARWWKNLNFARKLPFARDRLVECYYWVVGVFFEPQYALARKFLTKVIAMTSTIDDIYDVHGTIAELELFTQAVERWEISAIDTLPEYMKHCYQALLDMYSEMEEEMLKEGKSYRVHYARKAFEQEREHVPSAVECYMKQYGVSEEQACHEFNKQVEDAWKDTNQACLNPTATSSSVLTRMVNLARVIDLLYKEEDCYTHSTKLKDHVTSLFLDSIET